jgi:hypothetical protein
LTGSGIVNGTCDGDRFSCTGNSTATLTRINASATGMSTIDKASTRESSSIALLDNCDKILTIIDH